MSIRIPHLPLGFLVFLLCLKAAIAVAEQAQKTLVVFAAASLKEALEEVVALERIINNMSNYTNLFFIR